MSKGQITIAVDFLIERWHEIEAEPEPNEFQQGYQAACAVIMAAVVGKLKASKIKERDKI